MISSFGVQVTARRQLLRPFRRIPAAFVSSQESPFAPSSPFRLSGLQQVSNSAPLSRRWVSTTSNTDAFKSDFFAQKSFASIGIQSPVLLERLQQLGLEYPTLVQADTFSKLVASEASDAETKSSKDVIIGAETGSGKTLAYLLPLLDDILQLKASANELPYDYARAIVLVPNKELVQQVLRMALPLCGGANAMVWGGSGFDLNLDTKGKSSQTDQPVVRLAVLPGGLADPMDFKPFRDSKPLGGTEEPVDLIISTPAAVGPLGLKPKNINLFSDIRTLVVDEADMLLDGGYIRQLENILVGFRRADKLDTSWGGVEKTQHVFCAATLPDMGLKSVDAYLQRKFPHAKRIHMAGMHQARHSGLARATQWIGPIENKKERMDQLMELLETSPDNGGLKGLKVMVFLNSVEDVDGAQGAMERAGLLSVPYHAKISLAERSRSLDRFRRHQLQEDDMEDTVPILLCTDLASRGLDVPGVEAVVQLQFSGNVVSHLHRMGRCGRAGNQTGRGIVFYNEAETELVQVVQEAETQQENMVLEGDVNSSDTDSDASSQQDAGKVRNAFSRRRGFNKKRKKLQREARGN